MVRRLPAPVRTAIRPMMSESSTMSYVVTSFNNVPFSLLLAMLQTAFDKLTQVQITVGFINSLTRRFVVLPTTRGGISGSLE